jgi:hypothetical protein
LKWDVVSENLATMETENGVGRPVAHFSFGAAADDVRVVVDGAGYVGANKC